VIGPAAQPLRSFLDALRMVVVGEHSPLDVAEDEVIQLVGAAEFAESRRARTAEVVEGEVLAEAPPPHLGEEFGEHVRARVVSRLVEDEGLRVRAVEVELGPFRIGHLAEPTAERGRPKIGVEKKEPENAMVRLVDSHCHIDMPQRSVSPFI
jgi:hypothetical protein